MSLEAVLFKFHYSDEDQVLYPKQLKFTIKF